LGWMIMRTASNQDGHKESRAQHGSDLHLPHSIVPRCSQRDRSWITRAEVEAICRTQPFLRFLQRSLPHPPHPRRRCSARLEVQASPRSGRPCVARGQSGRVERAWTQPRDYVSSKRSAAEPRSVFKTAAFRGRHKTVDCCCIQKTVRVPVFAFPRVAIGGHHSTRQTDEPTRAHGLGPCSSGESLPNPEGFRRVRNDD
jgi:hypothetical protein